MKAFICDNNPADVLYIGTPEEIQAVVKSIRRNKGNSICCWNITDPTISMEKSCYGIGLMYDEFIHETYYYVVNSDMLAHMFMTGYLQGGRKL